MNRVVACEPDGPIEDLVHLVSGLPRVLELEAELEAVERVALPPWTGSTLHGALGHALRHVACSERCPAIHARDPDRCAYSRMFGAPARPGAVSERTAAMAPHRLWLTPPPPGEPRDLAPTERLRFGVRIVESAERDLGVLLTALEGMAARGLGRGTGRMRLARVSSAGRVLWDAGQAYGRASALAITPPPPGPLRLRARTPLRVVRGGVVAAPAFADLVGAAARRLVAVSAYYGRGEPDVHVRRLEETAAHFAGGVRAEWRRFRVERYSSSQRRRHPMHGHLGEMQLEGPTGFEPLFAAAVPFGIGKGTAFGFGAFELLGTAS